MKYRRLSKTQMSISVIGIGTWQLGGEWGKKFERDNLFEAAQVQKQLEDSLRALQTDYVEQVESNALAADLQAVRDDHPQAV